MKRTIVAATVIVTASGVLGAGGASASHLATCPADVDHNGVVDLDDFDIVRGALGQPSTVGDLDHDGDIDGNDLVIVLANLGPCGSGVNPPPTKPGQAWLIGVLDGNANDHNIEAIRRNFDL